MDRTKKMAVLLDYDGTLSPLAPHPDLAVIPPESKSILLKLANHPDVFVAVISGRNVQNVKSMVWLYCFYFQLQFLM